MSRLEELLTATSRTFAISIPLLPPPLRQQVTIAYLLFRVADTFEDASDCPPRERIDALAAFVELLRGGQASLPVHWKDAHKGYEELLADLPLVLEAFAALEPEAREILRVHVTRSADGMAEWVAATTEEGTLQLESVEELRRYCYVVAGIVGEMLTELFLHAVPQLAASAAFLRERSRAFGEGLQLVNILKDATDDAAAGRTYIPRGTSVADVFALARKDLDAAEEYTLALEETGAPQGIVAFAALPTALARATLDRLEVAGPGAKLRRDEVMAILQRVAPPSITSSSSTSRTTPRR